MSLLDNLRVERMFDTYNLVADDMGEDSTAFLLEGVSKARAERALRVVSPMLETSTRSQIDKTLSRG